jgi:hypothetical protein
MAAQRDGAIDPTNLTRTFTTLLRKAGLRRIRFHDLRDSTATLLLEQGVELVVIKELLGHAHIGVTATVYAHVRLRLQRDAIDTLSTALVSRETTETAHSDGDEPPPCAALVRCVAVDYCRQTPLRPPRHKPRRPQVRRRKVERQPCSPLTPSIGDRIATHAMASRQLTNINPALSQHFIDEQADLLSLVGVDTATGRLLIHPVQSQNSLFNNGKDLRVRCCPQLPRFDFEGCQGGVNRL